MTVPALAGFCQPSRPRAFPFGRAQLPAGGSGYRRGFFAEDTMRPIDEIRKLKTVADCHEWRKRNGDMDSMTYLALLQRIDALRKLEAGQ